MFNFARQQAVPDEAPDDGQDPSAAPALSRYEEIARALKTVYSGDAYQGPELPEELAQAFNELRRARDARGTEDLKYTVGFSIQSSQAMAAVSRITGNAEEVRQRMENMSAAVAQLDSAVQNISTTAQSSTEEMEEAAKTARESNDAITETTRTSAEISAAMERMSGRVEKLSEAVEQISEFINTVEAIASQTNLLALNATIEAARAGDAGKGFAVVASEVKTLSSETQKATDDINARIERLKADAGELLSVVSEADEAVKAGEKLFAGAQSKISRLDDLVTANSMRMNELADTLNEQSSATGQISEHISQVTEKAQQNAQNAQAVIDAIGEAKTLVGRHMSDLEEGKIKDYELYRAKADHYLWKSRLAEMLVGSITLEPDELSDHTACRLGRWYGKVSDENVRNHPAFDRLEPPHRRVHEAGNRAAELYEDGRIEAALAAYGEMEKASEEVVQVLDELIARNG